MSLTVYPLNLRGQVYGSPMPFGLYDQGGTLLRELKAVDVSAVVLLAEIEECREKTGRDLLALYKEEGLTVFSLPTPNYGIPCKRQLADVLKQARGRASDGHNVLIHCSAGLGRTALFAALLAKDILGLSGREAIEWLGRHKADALLTPAQIMMLMAYQADTNFHRTGGAMAHSLERLPVKERRGSRARCVLFTDGIRAEVAARLTSLVAPHAIVHPERHIWMPNGVADAMEGKLGEAKSFLSDGQRKEVTNWWLAVRHAAANTPNWDIVSQATIDGREGLILVEAKAHDQELIKAKGGKSLDENASENSQSNHAQIGACIQQASKALSSATGLPWSLSQDTHYQMSNRFAWAWKLTTMEIPVVLVYLGFLNATEMGDQGLPLTSHERWNELVEAQSRDLFPSSVWGKTWKIKNTGLTPLIRSATRSLV